MQDKTPATQRRDALDAVDRHLISLVRADSKRTLAQLGAEVGLSPPAVKRRIDRLEATGVIVGYAARIDDRLLHEGFDALIEIYCPDDALPSQLAESLSRTPEVLQAFGISGHADALARVRVASIGHLEALIERLRRDRRIQRTRTHVIMSTMVDRGGS